MFHNWKEIKSSWECLGNEVPLKRISLGMAAQQRERNSQQVAIQKEVLCKTVTYLEEVRPRQVNRGLELALCEVEDPRGGVAPGLGVGAVALVEGVLGRGAPNVGRGGKSGRKCVHRLKSFLFFWLSHNLLLPCIVACSVIVYFTTRI